MQKMYNIYKQCNQFESSTFQSPNIPLGVVRGYVSSSTSKQSDRKLRHQASTSTSKPSDRNLKYEESAHASATKIEEMKK
jgi:outer membrane usher protein FimD/PapC